MCCVAASKAIQAVMWLQLALALRLRDEMEPTQLVNARDQPSLPT